MATETDEDRAAFVDVSDFGDAAVYSAAAGGSGSLAGIFDDPSLSAEINDVSTIGARPTFCCRAAELPNGAEADSGDLLTVRGATYQVFSIEPDGQGMALLRLSQAD